MTMQVPPIDELLSEMTAGIKRLLSERGRRDPAMIGIHSGGAWIARQLHGSLGIKAPLGELNIAFYRDDFSRIGMHPSVKPSHLPFEVEDRHIVLIDDVLYTGRTVRAALNEIFDYGRPASVMLAVLVDRGGRELPIQADVSGMQMTLSPGEHVKLTGPEPLALVIKQAG